MSILQMSISASMLVIVVVTIRAFTLNKLPKTIFLILWGVILIRLLVPVSIPSQYSVYSIIGAALEQASPKIASPILESILPIARHATNTADETEMTNPIEVLKAATIMNSTQTANETEGAVQFIAAALTQVLSAHSITIIWLVGMFAMFIFFAFTYFNNQKVLRFSLPIRDNDFSNVWLVKNKLLRPLAVMQSDRITTPVAVGILNPRIILPMSMQMDDKQLLNYVFTHEYYHIRRFDTLWKLLLALALCIHWFNPMIWVMFILVNRDMELACDEMVIRRFGADTRTAYAYTLIGMAEQRAKFTPLYNSFSKNAAEERIRAIMKYRKATLPTVIMSILLVSLILAAFATNAVPAKNIGRTMAEENTANTNEITFSTDEDNLPMKTSLTYSSEPTAKSIYGNVQSLSEGELIYITENSGEGLEVRHYVARIAEKMTDEIGEPIYTVCVEPIEGNTSEKQSEETMLLSHARVIKAENIEVN